MNKKAGSLKKKIVTSMGGLVFIIIFIMTLIIYNKSTDITRKISLQDAENLARSSGKQVESIFNDAFDKSESMVAAIRALREHNPDRKYINLINRNILEKNPTYLGCWSTWATDAFDGKDKEFIGAKDAFTTGRYATYWVRDAGGVRQEPTNHREDETEAYYTVPERTKKPYATDPYFYKVAGQDVYMVTISVPILANGKFLGVAGCDFKMDQMKANIDRIKPYDVGYAFLCSNTSVIVAHPKKEFIGKKLSDISAEIGNMAKDKIARGETFSYEKTAEGNGSASRFIHVPVNFGNTGEPWSLAIVVPEDKLMEGPRTLRNYSVIIGLLGIVVVILSTIFLINKAFNPILKMKDMMKEVGEGEADMTRRLEVGLMDEVGETAYWFNVFVERMQNLIKEVKLNAKAVSSASLEISSSTEELSATVEEQSSQAQSVSTALSELSTTSGDIATSMEQSRVITENSSNMTKDGSKVIESAIDSLKQIEVQAGNLSKIVEDLGESTNQIGAIVEVINDVADQTNLLALNAAIEAARAGEHGRGFAVVADEVRKLAERTGKATDEIVSIIGSLQKKSEAASDAMKQTVEEVIKGREHGQQSLDILDKIVDAGTEVQNSSESVAAAIEEENATIEEISGSLQEMAAGTEESATAVQEVSGTADDLAKEAETLRSLVDQFVTD